MNSSVNENVSQWRRKLITLILMNVTDANKGKFLLLKTIVGWKFSIELPLKFELVTCISHESENKFGSSTKLYSPYICMYIYIYRHAEGTRVFCFQISCTKPICWLPVKESNPEGTAEFQWFLKCSTNSSFNFILLSEILCHFLLLKMYFYVILQDENNFFFILLGLVDN